MGLLDFMSIPKWKEVQRDFPHHDKLKFVEEEFWWIDEDEPQERLVGLNDFYKKCLDMFIAIAQDNHLLSTPIDVSKDLQDIGKHVVCEYLYDRYLVQRHETDPDIFYSYVTDLSFEAGITIANKWQDDSSNLDEYVDKIIRETSLDDIKGIYQQYLHVESEFVWLNTINKFSYPIYDMLKWYHKEENFEEYKLTLFLSAFITGAMVILSHKNG